MIITYVVFFVALFALMLLDFCVHEKKKFNTKISLQKILTYVLIVVFTVRYFCVSRSGMLGGYDGLKGLSAMGLNGFEAFTALIAHWFGLIAFLVICCRTFFNFEKLDFLARYFVPLSCIINIVALPVTVTFNFGTAVTGVTLFGIMQVIELALEISLSALVILRDGFRKKKVTAKFVFGVILWLVIMMFVAMPNFIPQYLFGFIKGYRYAMDLSPTHRIFLYLAFIFPLTAYFVLRDRGQEFKRFWLIFITTATMITFSITYSYENLLDLSSLPFHLCNTAMFVVPICLIFKLDKFFYFTYFINVLGAFFAMTMPNYNDLQNIMSYSFVNFWYNHWCAFFYPLLLVALEQFPRPKFKQFRYSMVWFLVYFIFVLILNVYFTAHGKSVDYFFINSDFIADKLGDWAENLFRGTYALELGGYKYVFHPLYQLLYFVCYVLMGFGMWFIYELFFKISDTHIALMQKLKKIKLDRYYLTAQLNGRSIDQPMNPDSGVKLELKHFYKRYSTNKDYAVKDANLEVFGGEVFGFLGPNGAGKSTIIKSIVGIQPITEGAIEVCGYDCAKQSVMAKRQIGYVPDHYALYEKLTGREYINYIADIFDVSIEDRNERIAKYVDLFELHTAIDNPIKTYSHGMKQKITIMAALVHNPKVWILDEPLTGLDPNSIYQVKECMRRHAEEGNIVFFSSHLIDVVEKLCNRITIIKKGEIQCTRTLEEIEKECSLEEFYLKTIGSEDLVEKEITATAEPAKN